METRKPMTLIEELEALSEDYEVRTGYGYIASSANKHRAEGLREAISIAKKHEGEAVIAERKRIGKFLDQYASNGNFERMHLLLDAVEALKEGKDVTQ